MSDFTQGIMITLVPALIVSIVTAYLTVRLSMRQFCSQRWWEKKAEAYSSIVEHLAFIQFYHEQHLSEIEGPNLPPDSQKHLNDGYRQAKESLSKARATGTYIISDDASAALQKLFVQLDKQYESWLDEAENDLEAVKQCIQEMKQCAKCELGKG